MLEMLAAQASVTIDNAMLFSATDEALARRLDELSQLRAIDLKLSEKLDLDATIAYTLEAACVAHARRRGLPGYGADGSGAGRRQSSLSGQRPAQQ